MKSLAVNDGVEKDARYTRTSHPNRSRRLASPGITALTSSSTLSRRAVRAGTRHLTRLRSPDVRPA